VFVDPGRSRNAPHTLPIYICMPILFYPPTPIRIAESSVFSDSL